MYIYYVYQDSIPALCQFLYPTAGSHTNEASCRARSIADAKY